MKIAFIGCGAAGRPLALRWIEAGHAIGAVICRTTTDEVVALLGQGEPGGNPQDADAVVFATPDDALKDVAARHALRPDQLALHLSGAHPSTVLAPTGARTASLHPLRAFASERISLEGTFLFVEGDPQVEELATDLGGEVVRVDTQGKLLYHAGAVVASNYVVTLLQVARDLLVRAGVEPALALAALSKLAAGAVDNVAGVGLPQALTGPAARGDAELIRRHVEALDPATRRLYAALLEATLPIARAKGGLSAEAETQLRDLIG
jgi:predicted short-subunit dehydrogenase-like oxidoreductase (DUF2520 family)